MHRNERLCRTLDAVNSVRERSQWGDKLEIILSIRANSASKETLLWFLLEQVYRYYLDTNIVII